MMSIRTLSDQEKTLSGQTVLVTGAGGFIGSHLTERLLQAGCEVRALVRYNSKDQRGFLQDNQHPSLEVVRGDVCDGAFVRDIVRDCQTVFHLAALIAIPYSYSAPGSYVDVNVQGTLNLLQAARELNVKRFLQTSTSEVYGSAQQVPMDENHPLRPQSPYAATKVASDQLALSFFYSFEMPVTVVRPFNTYGPRQSLRAVVPTICLQALRANTLHLGNTSSIRDLTYVEDTCAGFLHVASSPVAIGETINLGVGEGHRVEEIVAEVGRILGKQLSVEVDPARLRPPGSEVDRLISDNRKALRLANWVPQVGLRQGLEQLLDYVQEHETEFRSSYAL